MDDLEGIIRNRVAVSKHLYGNPDFTQGFFNLVMVMYYEFHDESKRFYLDSIEKEFVIRISKFNACHVKQVEGPASLKFHIIMTSNIDDDLQESVFIHSQCNCVLKYLKGLMGLCSEL